MKHRFLLALFFSPILGKPIHAPLPPAVYQAKTIAIVNQTGTQKVVDRAYEELQAWGRFTVVNDPAIADVVVIVGMDKRVVGASAHSYGSTTYITPTRAVDVTTSFVLKGHQESFFAETERAVLFRKSATKRCIDDLKKRMAEAK